MGSEIVQAKSRDLADYSPRDWNVLHPIVEVNGGVSPLLVESLAVVQLTAGEGSMDVYNDYRFAYARDGKFALSSLALSKIAAAAGVKWLPSPDSMVEARERRPDGHVYVRYRAAGAVRQPNGEWHIEYATKEIDTADVEDQIRDRDRRAWKGGRADWIQRAKVHADDVEAVEALIDDRVAQQILQLREHLLSHAETKAKSRVIRRLLSLSQVYAKTDLAKPFVVPRLVFDPARLTPDAVGVVRNEGASVVEQVFGNASDSGVSSSSAESPAEDEVLEADAPSRTEPGEDPVFRSGEFKGKHVSEVAALDPDYLETIVQGKRKATDNLKASAEEWLAFELGGSS